MVFAAPGAGRPRLLIDRDIAVQRILPDDRRLRISILGDCGAVVRAIGCIRGRAGDAEVTRVHLVDGDAASGAEPLRHLEEIVAILLDLNGAALALLRYGRVGAALH